MNFNSKIKVYSIISEIKQIIFKIKEKPMKIRNVNRILFIFALFLLFSVSNYGFYYYCYSTNPDLKFVQKRSKRDSEITRQLGARNITKINNNYYYWRHNRKKVYSYKTGKIIYTCGLNISRIVLISYHPKYGILLVCQDYNKKKAFYSIKTGKKISKWGEYYHVKNIQRYKNKYVFKAGNNWRKWFYVDTVSGKPIKKWGTYRYLGDIQKIRKSYYFYARQKRKYFFVNTKTGKSVWGKYDTLDNKIFRIGNRSVFKAGKKGNYFYVDTRSGKPAWGKYNRVNQIRKIGKRYVFKAYYNRKYFYVNTANGKPVWGKYKRLRKIKKYGKKYIFKAYKNRKWFYVDISNGKIYGDKYKYVKDFQNVGKMYVYKVKQDGQEFYVDTSTEKPVWGKYKYLVKNIQRIRDKYVFRASNYKEYFYVDTKTGRPVWGIYNKFIQEIQKYGNKYVFKARHNRKYFYIDTRNGKPVGGKFLSVGKIKRAEKKYVFRAKRNKKYFYVDVMTGKRVWGKYDYIRDGFQRAGKKYFFEARHRRKCFYINTKSHQLVGGKFDRVYYISKKGNKYVFLAKRNNKYMYVNVITGRIIGGNFNRVSKIFNVQNKFVFFGMRNKQYQYINLATGRPIWGKYNKVEKILEAGNKYVFKARKGDKEYYVDTDNGRPWGGIFKEVKRLANNKGVITFYARTGQEWKIINPFKFIDYIGMKYISKKSKLFPSQITIKNRKKRIIGMVILKNPFNETVNIRLELSSMDFPKFYGKKSSVLGVKIRLKPNEVVKDVVVLPFSEKFWELYKKQIINCTLKAYIKTDSGREGSQTIDLNLTIASRDRIKWDDIRNIAPFANTDDPTIIGLAKAVKGLSLLRNWQMPPKIEMFLKAYEVCRVIGLNYSFMSIGLGNEDSIKMPFEIIKDKLGKCTDTTILYATLLSKLGYSSVIATFTYKRANQKISHLMLLIDTGVNAKDYRFLHSNKNMLIVPKGLKRCYIPVETTGMVASRGQSINFFRAWKRGVTQYRQHENQILKSKNAFRLRSAWMSGFSQMTPKINSLFKISKNKKRMLKIRLRTLMNKYVKTMLENKKEEKKYKSRLKSNNYYSQIKMGQYYYKTRRYLDAGKYFRNAGKINPSDTKSRYYLLSTLVYTAFADDPFIRDSHRKKARKNFFQVSRELSRILKRTGLRRPNNIFYAMNYDLAKWYNAFSKTGQAKIHRNLAKRIQKKITQRKTKRYSGSTIRKLRRKGFSIKAIKYLASKGFSEKSLISLVLKGFSEDILLSLATKGFSEDILLSLATKGFSEDVLLSLATKGFAENIFRSLATKGYSEEDWGMSR